MSAEQKRLLKIKVAALKRVSKELVVYKQEKDAEVAKVERLKASGADPHDLKHAEDVLAEAAMMLPDTRQRLEAAVKDLQSFLAGYTVKGSEEELAASKQAVQDAGRLIEEEIA